MSRRRECLLPMGYFFVCENFIERKKKGFLCQISLLKDDFNEIYANVYTEMANRVKFMIILSTQ